MIEQWYVIPDLFPFKLEIDPAFPQDVAMLYYANKKNVPEPETVNLMTRVLKPGDTVVDGGASIGFFTAVMARLVGETGCVVAFEPDSRAVKKLAKNCNLNDFGNVVIHNFALWDNSEDPQTFYEAVDSGFSSLHDTRGDAFRQSVIQVCTLDDYLSVTPKLIKLDIEGAEQHALTGMCVHLAPYIVCELNKTTLACFDHSDSSLRELMLGKGYYTFLLAVDGALPRLVPPKTEISTAFMREGKQQTKENVNVLFASIDSVGEVWGTVDGT
jgi:FkbM family methyltransferase